MIFDNKSYKRIRLGRLLSLINFIVNFYRVLSIFLYQGLSSNFALIICSILPPLIVVLTFWYPRKFHENYKFVPNNLKIRIHISIELTIFNFTFVENFWVPNFTKCAQCIHIFSINAVHKAVFYRSSISFSINFLKNSKQHA